MSNWQEWFKVATILKPQNDLNLTLVNRHRGDSQPIRKLVVDRKLYFNMNQWVQNQSGSSIVDRNN